MTHLIVRKLPNGKYKIFNKNTKSYEGVEMVDEDQAIKAEEKLDEKQDKEMENSKK